MATSRTRPDRFYVYAIFRPWDGSPCYIGKGMEDRINQHRRAGANHYNPMLADIFKEAKRLGIEVPIAKIRQSLTNGEALDTEIALISAIGRGGLGPLVNMTDGGEGMSGHKASEDHKRKISAAQKHRAPASAETRAKISAARKGTKASEETRKKLSAAKIGNRNAAGQDRSWFRHTAASKAKLSASRQGIAGSFTGKKHTNVTRKKISLARKAMFARKTEGAKWKLSLTL